MSLSTKIRIRQPRFFPNDPLRMQHFDFEEAEIERILAILNVDVRCSENTMDSQEIIKWVLGEISPELTFEVQSHILLLQTHDGMTQLLGEGLQSRESWKEREVENSQQQGGWMGCRWMGCSGCFVGRPERPS